MKLLHLTMARVFAFVLILSSVLPLHSQVLQSVATRTSEAATDWHALMQDPDATFESVQDAFNRWFEGRTDTVLKGTGYKVFKRWEYRHEFRVLPDGRLQPPGYVAEQHIAVMKAHSTTKSPSGNWSLVGPSAYPINNTSQPTGMGRINAIAFHPTDANTLYSGAPSGGIWKSIDGGSSWTNISTNLPFLGISAILIHPTNPDIILIGTGDRDAGDAPGMGVWISTDGGASWSASNTTMGNVTVGDLLMHPSNPDIIIAATSGGIYKSTNGGVSWSLRLSSVNCKDIEFKPGDPSTVYATTVASPARFYSSANTGDSWTQNTSVNTTGLGSRMVIGVSPANPNYVYLVQIKSADNTFLRLLRSTDSGVNFTSRSTSPNLLGYDCNGSDGNSQAWYDLCIAVDPNNAEILYVGGVNIWKSTNGGTSWSINAHWVGGSFNSCAQSVHADHHTLVWSPLNGRLFSGHDGGIHWTSNGGSTWTEISAGLEIAQMYKIGQSATNANLVIMGNQDNGTSLVNGTTLYTVIGGDGMECEIDYSNSNFRYGSLYYGDIRRSTGGSYSKISGSISETGAWVTPFMLHRTVPSTMFAGFRNVFRSTNVKNTTINTISWSAISSGETTTCRVIEQSPANVDVLYVARSGSLKRSDNANASAGSVTWTTCALPGGTTPSDIKAHPTNQNVVYATAGYGVFRSTNKGASWTNISGNLPSLFINCIAIDKNGSEALYVGNQTGVWFKDTTMTSWILFSSGLPPVDVRELEIWYDPVGTQHLIKAGTYGRGLWQSDLIDIGSVENPAGFVATALSQSQIDLEWALNAADDEVMLAYSTSPSFGAPDDGVGYAPASLLPGGGTVLYNGDTTAFSHTQLIPNTTYYYKLWSYNNNQEYSFGTTTDARTLCNTYTLPLTEPFAGTTIPDCWSQVDHLGNGQVWEFGAITGYGTSDPNLSGNYAYLNSDAYGSANSQNVDLVTPTLDLTTFTGVNLSFQHYYRHYTGSAVTLSYSINDGVTWTQIQTWSSSTANPATFSQSIPAADGQPAVKFRWKFDGSWGYYWAVDDVSITGTLVGSPFTGVVSYPNGPGITLDGITVELKQGGATMYSTTTAGNGTFSLPAVAPGTYDVLLSGFGNTGGINATDAELINDFNILNYPVEEVAFLAGDANQDGAIFSYDAALVLGWFVDGAITNTGWVYRPAGNTVSANTWAYPPSPSVTIGGSPLHVEYYALARGDFNMSFDPYGSKATGNGLSLAEASTLTATPGQVTTIPVSTVTPITVRAISLILNYPPGKAEVMEVLLPPNPAAEPILYSTATGELRIGWTDLYPLSYGAGEELLLIKIKTDENLKPGEMIRFTMAHDPLNELADQNIQPISNVTLMIPAVVAGEATAITGHRNPVTALSTYPNPFTGSLGVTFRLASPETLTLEVTDITGRLVHTMPMGTPGTGEHNITLNTATWSAGAYVLTLRGAGGERFAARTAVRY